jgi:hypothetical protein
MEPAILARLGARYAGNVKQYFEYVRDNDLFPSTHVSHPARPDPSTAIFTTADGVRIVTLRGDLGKDAREPVHETR